MRGLLFSGFLFASVVQVDNRDLTVGSDANRRSVISRTRGDDGIDAVNALQSICVPGEERHCQSAGEELSGMGVTAQYQINAAV